MLPHGSGRGGPRPIGRRPAGVRLPARPAAAIGSVERQETPGKVVSTV